MAKQKSICVTNLQPAEVKRGMTGFARTDGAMGWLIRAGEKLRWKDGRYNHCFTVVTEGATYDEIWIVQATMKGVLKSTLASLIASSELISMYDITELGGDPEKAAWFAEKQIGKKYGLLSDICIGVDIISPAWFLEFRRAGTWICSAVAHEAMRFAGVYFDVPDVYMVSPTNLQLLMDVA
jgi:hypothetical protein